MADPEPTTWTHHPGLADLLRVLDPTGRHDRTRAVYANRNLRMDSIEVVGFDMDYTLALYQMEAFERLGMGKTVDKLVARGYPGALRELEYDRSFVIRGLVVDKRYGNLFKMDRHRHVGRVFHGFRRLDKTERRRIYRAETVRPAAARYHLIDTLFALPEAWLFASIVDLFERRGRKGVDYHRLFTDIRSSIDEAHRDDSIKEVVVSDLDSYVISDPGLALTLHKLRSSGKRLFVLTNSLFHYTDALMGHLLDGVLPEYPSWRNYFDLVMVGARKPGFFSKDAPFLPIDDAGRNGSEPAARLEKGRAYKGGNLALLQRNLRAAPDRVLYVGDHIYGDVLRAKKTTAWRTAMVIEEMERELAVEERLEERLRELVRLEGIRVRLDERVARDQAVLRALQKLVEAGLDRYSPNERAAVREAHRRAREALDTHRRALRGNLKLHAGLQEEVDGSYNRYWGPLFREGVEHSSFGGQVEAYACIYTSRVSNFLAYSPACYFRAPRDRMPHERF